MCILENAVMRTRLSFEEIRVALSELHAVPTLFDEKGSVRCYAVPLEGEFSDYQSELLAEIERRDYERAGLPIINSNFHPVARFFCLEKPAQGTSDWELDGDVFAYDGNLVYNLCDWDQTDVQKQQLQDLASKCRELLQADIVLEEELLVI